MRALYLDDITNDLIELSGDKFHHLVNVVRIKQNDEILLLNGRGQSRRAIVQELKKKSLTLKSETIIHSVLATNLSVALGIPKKEALELSLKQAVELGAKKIYLIQSTYSQKLNLNEERRMSLLISALEQSNNHWLPEIILLDSLESFLALNCKFAYFSSQTKRIQEEQGKGDIPTLLIGPEAGFSEEEEKLLIEKANMLIHFDEAIMRTPTALACGLGFLKAYYR